MKLLKWMGIGTSTVCIIGFGLTLIPNPSADKAERVSRSVRAMPMGLSTTQVAAFLKKEDIEGSYIIGRKALDSTSNVSRVGYTSADVGGYYFAMIRGTSGGFLVTGDTQYSFFSTTKMG